MKLAIVTSPQLLDFASHEYSMCLAHLASESDRYFEFYRDLRLAGGEVIMDNGAAEGLRLGLDELVNLAASLKPSVVVVPDEPNNTDATLDLFKDSYSRCVANQPIMMVPQGISIASWTRCLLYMHGVAQGQNTNWIGISKYTLNWLTASDRGELLKILMLHGLHMQYKVHLLGLKDPMELLNLRHEFPWIHGCDTSLPVAMGLAGYELSDYEDVGKVDMDFDSYPTEERWHLIQQNIWDLRRLAGLDADETYQPRLEGL